MSSEEKKEEEKKPAELAFEERMKLNEAWQRNQRELAQLVFEKLNEFVKTVSSEYSKFEKYRRLASAGPLIILGIIIGAMSYLAVIRVISGDALVFVMGTVAGYVYAILRKLVE